jgi:hypothetical protein
MEPTADEERLYREWVTTRPAVVRAIAERVDPWSVYRLTATGPRVRVVSIAESGTVTVDVDGTLNAVAFARQVFGIDPQDLVPADLPAPEEPLGEALSPAQVAEYRDELRLAVRPDLWERLDDGRIVWRDPQRSGPSS